MFNRFRNCHSENLFGYFTEDVGIGNIFELTNGLESLRDINDCTGCSVSVFKAEVKVP